MFSSASRLATGMGLAAVLVFSATFAHAQDVRFNAMPGTDFAKYKTYAWVKIQGAQQPDDITSAQIQASIDKQLAAKGLTKAEADTADLYVGYQVSLDQEKQWNAYSMGTGPGWGWGPGYGGYGYGGNTTTATSTTINIGTLGVDIYDRAAKQLVWRGTASKTLDPKAKPEKRAKNLDKATAKLLKNFPPPPPKS